MISRRRGFEGSAVPPHAALHPAVQRWMWQQGFEGLRDLAVRALPSLTSGTQDVLLAGPARSGRHTALSLALFSTLAERSESTLGALWIVPDAPTQQELLCQLESLSITAGVKIGAALPARLWVCTLDELEHGMVAGGPEVCREWIDLEAIAIDDLDEILETARGPWLESLLSRIDFGLDRHVPRLAVATAAVDAARAALVLHRDADSSLVVHTAADDSAPAFELRLEEGSEEHAAPLTFCSGDRSFPVFSVRALRHRVERAARREEGARHSLFLRGSRRGTPGLLEALELRMVEGLALLQGLASNERSDLDLEDAGEDDEDLWCVHQLRSLLAQHGALFPRELYGALSRQGPFRELPRNGFVALLDHLARIGAVHPRHDGTVSLEPGTEREGDALRSASTHATGGVPDSVRERMLEIYASAEMPGVLRAEQRARLERARQQFSSSELAVRSWVETDGGIVLLPFAGDRALRTLAAWLEETERAVELHGAAIWLPGWQLEEHFGTLHRLGDEPRPPTSASIPDLLPPSWRDARLVRNLDLDGAWRTKERLLRTLSAEDL